MKTTSKFINPFLAIVLLCACKQGPDYTHNARSLDSDSLGNKTLQDIIVTLPSPVEIVGIFLEHSENLPEDPDLIIISSEMWIDSRTKAIALGGYSADFAYQCLMENEKNHAEYMTIIGELLKELHIYDVSSYEIAGMLQDNPDNPDTLAMISLNLFQNMVSTLENTGQHEILSLILTGAIIECLYLGQAGIRNYEEGIDLINDFINSKEIFMQYYRYTARYEQSDLLSASFMHLKAIKDAFEKLPVHTIEKTTEKQRDGTLIIKGGQRITASEEEFQNLKETIIKSRKAVLNVSK